MSYQPLHEEAEKQIANAMDWATLRETDMMGRDRVLGLMRWAMRWAYADAVNLCNAEYLCDETGEPGDVGYDHGITDCITSIEARHK